MDQAIEHRQYVNGSGFWPTAANVGVRILERHGLATVLVLFGCYWGTVHLANPLVASHLETMRQLADNNTKIVDTQEAQTVILQEIRLRLDRLEDGRGVRK